MADNEEQHSLRHRTLLFAVTAITMQQSTANEHYEISFRSIQVLLKAEIT
jgi:hypothetical protein